MPAQLKRLLPLFIVFVSLFLLVRHLLIPDTFGQYGHYRGDALHDNVSREIIHASKEDCYDCHDDIREVLENDMHKGLSCLICHGPGLAHVENPEASNILKQDSRKFCGSCHQLHPARSSSTVSQVDLETHNPEMEKCIDCHHPHEVWEGMQ